MLELSGCRLAPEAAGDVLAVTVLAGNSSDPQPYITAVSGGGVTTWSKAVQWAPTTSTDSDMEIWWGVVTATGASNIDLTWDTTPGGSAAIVQEFSAPAGATWSFGGSGNDSSGQFVRQVPLAQPRPALAKLAAWSLAIPYR